MLYIVAIAWLYVVVLMAATERNVVAGVMTFLIYGVVPLAVFLLVAASLRRRILLRRVRMGGEQAHQPDRSDAEADQ